MNGLWRRIPIGYDLAPTRSRRSPSASIRPSSGNASTTLTFTGVTDRAAPAIDGHQTVRVSRQRGLVDAVDACRITDRWSHSR